MIRNSRFMKINDSIVNLSLENSLNNSIIIEKKIFYRESSIKFQKTWCNKNLGLNDLKISMIKLDFKLKHQ